eukprot:TRINITY_DN15833_c0_g1_i4.p4 TRINITY_DN15833_c0_g1~~TRINITY_DN15833_c0_g1_i4.p4  ORF type:complete len:145 (-),score=5.16 TRINITY_DN15833_c0_g1_i4:65-499(-)
MWTHEPSPDNSKRLQVWVVGFYERNTGDTRCYIAKERNEAVLEGLVKRNVDRNSTVYTDGWRGYTRLKDLGYSHIVIEHTKGFGTGRRTTNHIESMWSQLKDYAKIYSDSLLPKACEDFAEEFILRYDAHRYELDINDLLSQII